MTAPTLQDLTLKRIAAREKLIDTITDRIAFVLESLDADALGALSEILDDLQIHVWRSEALARARGLERREQERKDREVGLYKPIRQRLR